MQPGCLDAPCRPGARARRGAAAEAIDAHEAVHIFTQQPKQPPIVAAAGNPEMEILVAAGLVVGGAACHIRLPAMRRQALFECIQISSDMAAAASRAAMPSRPSRIRNKFLKIARLQVDDACPEMGNTMDQPFASRRKMASRSGARLTPEPRRKVDFVDGFPGRDAALHDRLHDLVEDAIGERYARDGLDGGALSTVYSHSGMSHPRRARARRSQGRSRKSFQSPPALRPAVLPDALGAAHVGDGLVQGVREHGGAVWIGSDLDGEELRPSRRG